MKEAYRALMKRVTVTPEMEGRILEKLRRAGQEEGNKMLLLPKVLRSGWAVAACLAVLLVGSITLHHFLPAEQVDLPPMGQGNPYFTSCTALEDLAKAVGFTVEDLSSLPFAVTDTTYTAFGTEMAEVRYSGAEQTLVFRKAAGAVDPSGDYTEYASIWEEERDGVCITWKGDDRGAVLALWRNGGYSYSLRASEPLSKTQWDSLLSELL